MARLLIVSRSMALAMRLADQHEVIEHPVDDLDSLGTDLDADVLVLDIGDPIQAVTTVNELRQAGQITPVLLVSGYQPEWEQVEAQQVDGVVVVPLPITRAALLSGIARLTGPSPSVAEQEAGPQPEPAPERPGATHNGAQNGARNGTGPGGDSLPGTLLPAVAEDHSADDADDDADDSEAAADAEADPGARTWSGAGTGTGASDAAGDDNEVEAEARARPPAHGRVAPPWGSPEDPGRPPVPPAQTGSPGAPVPMSPPWGETIRVGQRPAARQGRSEVAARDNTGQTGADGAQPNPLGPPSRRLPLLGNRPRKLQRRPAVTDSQGLGLVTDPLGPRTDPFGLFPGPPGPPATPASIQQAASSALDRRLDAEAAAIAGDRSTVHRSSSGLVMRPSDLVQSLLDQVGDLYGVSDTAQVLADDVIERADADAAAILVPDGPIWRVSGGVGLRPLERRLILEPSHWLITEIGSAGRAVLIDDTDIIRQQLAGAPLAAWRHLLAVPVPDVRAIVVLARGQEAGPFTDRDLSAVIAPVREAAALLAQAVQTRRLARALSALREADPEPPPRRRDE